MGLEVDVGRWTLLAGRTGKVACDFSNSDRPTTRPCSGTVEGDPSTLRRTRSGRCDSGGASIRGAAGAQRAGESYRRLKVTEFHSQPMSGLLTMRLSALPSAGESRDSGVRRPASTGVDPNSPGARAARSARAPFGSGRQGVIAEMCVDQLANAVRVPPQEPNGADWYCARVQVWAMYSLAIHTVPFTTAVAP